MLVRIWRNKKPSESISQNEGAPQAGNSSQPRKKLGQVGEPDFPAGCRRPVAERPGVAGRQIIGLGVNVCGGTT